MREALSFLLSVAPAAYLWWVGRRLVRRIDGFAFPELRFGRGQRLGIVIAVCFVSSLVLTIEYAALKITLAVLSLLVANYPARREIFGESWGLLGYLSCTLRFWLARGLTTLTSRPSRRMPAALPSQSRAGSSMGASQAC